MAVFTSVVITDAVTVTVFTVLARACRASTSRGDNSMVGIGVGRPLALLVLAGMQDNVLQDGWSQYILFLVRFGSKESESCDMILPDTIILIQVKQGSKGS